MLSRRKNLLEAFKRSDAAGAPPAGPAPAAAPGVSAPKPAPAGPLFESSLARSSSRQPLGAMVAVGLVITFVLGFVIGRGTGGESRAEEKETPVNEGRRLPPANQPRVFQEQPKEPAVPAPTPARLEDSALFDLANVYTVVVAAYSNTNEELARATYQHLLERGLPVFPPVVSKNLLLVVAGAAPTTGELKQLEATVKELTRDGKKAYGSAYQARIDALFPRTPKKGQEKP